MAIYTESDYTSILAQKKKRWILLLIPIALLLVGVVVSFIFRIEWLTTACTILAGGALIAGYDFAIRPLRCYAKHLNDMLHGRTRECELAFIALSEDIDVVDGVACRSFTCSDIDGKNRPYERLFYFDAQKEFPKVAEGAMLHIVHHDLMVADIYPAA